ncbi:MAG: UDP-N-acetylmuramoyl-L-alanine--D-glutamate ligase [Pseudomonadota bacterium]
MIPAVTYAGKRVAVFGLGASGRATIEALEAVNADVFAWDDSRASRDKLARSGLTPTNLRRADWTTIDALVLAPGVPLTHPEPHWTVKKAKEAGVPVIGDTEIFVQALAASGSKTVHLAITGTNGKSTTTALLGHILKSAGRATEVGGNIGRAVLDLQPPADGRHYVVEFSSYQIDLTPSLKPDAGILLNLTPDHLDRHGDMAGYAAVKQRMFALQDEDDVAIIGVDDDHCRVIAGQVSGPEVMRISVEAPVFQGVSVREGTLEEWHNGARVAGTDLTRVEGLRGSHNWQNAAAAWAACRSIGLKPAQIASGFASFPGLAHRMEQVGRFEKPGGRGSILFINDSKATNADAAARALASFQNVYWIAGGLAKDGGIDGLSDFFPEIRRSYLVGEAAPAFAETLLGHVKAFQSGTIDNAVAHAFEDAAADSGDAVILLSPACASFDQYRNFEIRGDAFKAAVAALDGVSLKAQEAA